ncbi:NADPH:quinone reductase [Pedobacter westerhofensis]|uniref:NADPH:quinone reductase n=2 Tax=Pedobacter westerhofensis TaxID=425512 RepID=A0A521DSQ2_9SPHI|nr:NADPH:quinone reductase [Pedobacter westerhofensis]
MNCTAGNFVRKIMKAIVLNEFGGVDQLLMTEVPVPIISDDEVLVEVKAISINPVDVRTRQGSAMADHLKNNHPLILGWDISGVIKETGKNVSRFSKGDEVFGLVNFLGHGQGYAEYVAAPEAHLARKPTNISHEQAAAATLSALTAWQLLNNYAKLKAGESILILAASGGVGHFAVQMASYVGASVIGVSSAKNREFVLGLGADEHIAYDEKEFKDIISEVDVVLDAFSGDSLFKSLQVVKQKGIILSLLPFISEEVLQKAKLKEVDVHYELVHSSGADMDIIAGLLAKGAIKPYVSELFPFEEMAKAHLCMESNRTVGKIIVQVSK